MATFSGTENLEGFVRTTVSSGVGLSAVIDTCPTILFDKFSMNVEDWEYADGLVLGVDVVDLYFNINTSNTYFLHDGSPVLTTFSGITNGYRAYYAPTDTIASGTITITIRGENDAGGVAMQNYYLLHGYHVEYNTPTNWGAKQMITTIVKASNEVFCPNVAGEATYFETKDYPSEDLGAFINPIPSVDLGATIYPQSTAFFYGKTYIITVSGVRDYSGNEMSPYSFTFTIENPL